MRCFTRFRLFACVAMFVFINFYPLLISVETLAALEKGTYGIPMSVELIDELATARGLTVDMTGYKNLLQERKVRIFVGELVL